MMKEKEKGRNACIWSGECLLELISGRVAHACIHCCSLSS